MPIDAKKLDKEYVLQGHGTTSELREGLARAAVLEAKSKARVRRYRYGALISVTAGVGLTIAGLVVFLPIGVVAAIGLFIKSFFVQTVLKDRLELLRLMLSTLDLDSRPGARFDLTVHLHAHLEQIPGGTSQQTLYKDYWYTLSGRLRDGTTIAHSVTDFTRQRSKKSRGGKTKTKTRKAVLLYLRVSYDPAVYGDASITLRHARNPFRYPEGTVAKGVKATNRNLTVKAMVLEQNTAARLHAASESMLLGAYRILNLSRHAAAAQVGRRQ